MQIPKILIILAILLFSVPARAEQSPADVLKAYADATRAKKWDEIALLYDPAGLKEFRKRLKYYDTRNDSESAEHMRKVYYGEGASVESVAKLTDGQFFVGHLKASLGMEEVINPESQPEALHIVGTLPEGDDTAHVVFHLTQAGDPSLGKEYKFRSVNVATLKKTEGKWRLAVTEMNLMGADYRAKRIEEDLERAKERAKKAPKIELLDP